jgi:UPF0176 protein
MTHVATFYRFARIESPQRLAEAVRAVAHGAGVKGTVLVAREGINGTLAGSPESLVTVRDALHGHPQLRQMPVRLSTAAAGNPVFHRLKVRVKEEIVALRQPGLDPAAHTGVHVDAARWNELLAAEGVVVIDTRNTYEVAVGTFPGAINPGTRSFREFPDWVATNLDPQQHQHIAMFCTGGVRCEKASAYLLSQGFARVYQLDGGVLNYLETAGADNRWQGECFVFDQRVAVTDALDQGSHTLCHACRRPLDAAALASPDFVDGVSCPSCVDSVSPQRRAGFAERVRQERLAATRGERHVGATMPGAGAGHRNGGQLW